MYSFIMPAQDVTMTVKCISEWQALKNALLNSGTYKASDYDFDGDGVIRAGSDDTALVIPQGKNVTLNLRGVAIDRDLDPPDPEDPINSDLGSGSVIIINGGTLTLKDSNPQRSHDDLPSGGLITGGYATGSGGGVCVYSARDLHHEERHDHRQHRDKQ